MAVPAHDSRDYAFAKHFGLPIIPLIEGCDVSEESFDAKQHREYMPDDAAEQSALNRQGITENARRVKELEREVAELKALVAKLVDEH